MEKHKPIILIAEDDPFMLTMLRYKLDKHYQVVTATNGLDALNLAKRIKPDLILTDMYMPLRSGIELAAYVKHNITPPPKVIFLTAANQISVMEQAIQSGADDYITKPFSPDLLTKRIASCLDSSTPPSINWWK